LSSAQKNSEIATGAATKPARECEPASPVCYAGEARDVYAGYAAHEEILAFLNVLLEVARAHGRRKECFT
jgi:hypothetical protein